MKVEAGWLMGIWAAASKQFRTEFETHNPK
jgi:hypothetical protein